MEADIWNFPLVIYQYLDNYYYFKIGYSFMEWPFKVELKKLQSLVFAYSGIDYNIESVEGRDKIKELFDNAFGSADLICSDSQIIQLRELFPYKAEVFDQYKSNMPRIGDFYSIIFDLLRLGFEYINLCYPVKYPVAVDIVRTFKAREIDLPVDNKNDILIEAIMILLGDRFRKSFTSTELIRNYHFPKF